MSYNYMAISTLLHGSTVSPELQADLDNTSLSPNDRIVPLRSPQSNPLFPPLAVLPRMANLSLATESFVSTMQTAVSRFLKTRCSCPVPISPTVLDKFNPLYRIILFSVLFRYGFSLSSFDAVDNIPLSCYGFNLFPSSARGSYRSTHLCVIWCYMAPLL